MAAVQTALGADPRRRHQVRLLRHRAAVRNPLWNFFSEVLGTFILVLVATALFSKRVAPAGVAAGLGPLLVGTLVLGIGLSLGGTTGYAINPAVT